MEKALKELGLGENEAKIYLAALAMEPFIAGTMSKKTQIKRSTTYLALDNLIKLGLIKEKISGKKKLFVAESPAALEKLTKRMRRKVIDAEILVEKLVPELASISKISYEEPELTFYPSLDGVKNVLLEISGSTKPWYWFGASREMLKKIAPKDIAEIIEEGDKLRYKAGLPKIKFITDSGILQMPFFRRGVKTSEIKTLKQNIQANSAFVVFEDKLAVFNFNAPFVAVIKSREVAEVIRTMYDLMWQKL